MKAFILAAGLGTRLRPWTLSHPKALVPVEGVPMLQRVIERLIAEGFNNITVNVHHFAEQIAKGDLDIPVGQVDSGYYGAFTESFDIMREELWYAK